MIQMYRICLFVFVYEETCYLLSTNVHIFTSFEIVDPQIDNSDRVTIKTFVQYPIPWIQKQRIQRCQLHGEKYTDLEVLCKQLAAADTKYSLITDYNRPNRIHT